MNWSGVDYCDVFSNWFDFPSDGTHSLQRIHWWASVVMLNSSKSVPMKRQTHLHLSTFSANVHFWVNYSFKYGLVLTLQKQVRYLDCNRRWGPDPVVWGSAEYGPKTLWLLGFHSAPRGRHWEAEWASPPEPEYWTPAKQNKNAGKV